MPVLTDADFEAERAASLNAILSSDAPRKLIVAGPGTGKTHTYRTLLKQINGNSLAITFLLSLVADLQESLSEFSDVQSFHGLAKKLLHSLCIDGITPAVHYFPAIDQIYATDLSIIDRPTSVQEISTALLNLSTDGVIIPGILRSGNYYNVVGHSDSVYRVFRALEGHPETVPRYSQLVVDEYQDFNLLEVSLIKLLATASPTLIVGDDDQALYGFKHASSRFIRELANDPAFVRFELPYCSRCTEVLVEAVNLTVAKAQAVGLLAARVQKRYQCFSPAKRIESVMNPKIIYARCTVETRKTPDIGRYIESRIRDLPINDVLESREKTYPTVLIIGPKEFITGVYSYLSSRMLNIEYRSSAKLEVTPLDGYKLLLSNQESRLGWRILLEIHSPESWKENIKEVLLNGLELEAILNTNFKSEQLEIVGMLRRIRENESLSVDEWELVTTATNLAKLDLLEEIGIVEDIFDNGEEDAIPVQALTVDGPTVLVTSLLGAKGLEAGHVFVVGLNNHHFPRQNATPTEDEVCQLIVALTRARKSCTLISTGRFGNELLEESIFINWLYPLIEKIQINKNYFDTMQ